MSMQTCDSGGFGDEWKRDVWGAGDYARTAKQYLPMAARLADAVGIEASDRVLDVGTGTGNLAIPAARAGADVTGIDICTELLETARARTEAVEVGDIAFDTGDAADLPYADDTFDVTVSNVGHMYADPPMAAARELLRVTRPGGRVGFTAWTPMSLYPRMAGVALQHVPPTALPDYTEPPFMWGDVATVRDRLADDLVELTTETREITYPTVAPTAFWDETKETSGMFQKLVSSIDDAARKELDADMVAVIDSAFDPSENGIPLRYLEAIGTVETD